MCPIRVRAALRCCHALCCLARATAFSRVFSRGAPFFSPVPLSPSRFFFSLFAGLLCDLLWSDPEADISGWAENDRGVSYTFGADVVSKFLQKHDYDLIVRAHQVVEDGYEFFADRQLVTIFTAPNYCGEFDNAGAVMAVDESLMCSFRILKPADKKKYAYGGMGSGRPLTPPRKR